MGVDTGDLAVLDERGDNLPVLAAFIGAGEKGILPIECEGPDLAFDDVAIEIDAAIS